MENNKIIRFDTICEPAHKDLENLHSDIDCIAQECKSDHAEMNDLIKEINSLSELVDINVAPIELFSEDCESLNSELDNIINKKIKEKKFSRLPKLTTQDVVVSSIAGIISVIIDVVFVGTPEVVRVLRGGKNFDGSILTSSLRKLGNDKDGNLTSIFGWLSDKCKVPYDIPLKSGILTPNNHRLRSFSHDPLFGLFFAVADIILGTTTCINSQGMFTVLVNKNKAPTIEKWLSALYYLGHIISDLCTARGIPIPGFCLTQFFAGETGESSIAQIAEAMYRDGYDLRHFASMSVPVFVKDIIIKLYLRLTQEDPSPILSISEKEKFELDQTLKIQKMKFIANSIATVGNAVKIIAPPNCGNICALNIPQWIAFIENSLIMGMAYARDTSAEEALYNRDDIDKKWRELLS